MKKVMSFFVVSGLYLSSSCFGMGTISRVEKFNFPNFSTIKGLVKSIEKKPVVCKVKRKVRKVKKAIKNDRRIQLALGASAAIAGGAFAYHYLGKNSAADVIRGSINSETTSFPDVLKNVFSSSNLETCFIPDVQKNITNPSVIKCTAYKWTPWSKSIVECFDKPGTWSETWADVKINLGVLTYSCPFLLSFFGVVFGTCALICKIRKETFDLKKTELDQMFEDVESLRVDTFGDFEHNAASVLARIEKINPGELKEADDKQGSLGNLFANIKENFVKASKPCYYYLRNSINREIDSLTENVNKANRQELNDITNNYNELKQKLENLVNDLGKLSKLASDKQRTGIENIINGEANKIEELKRAIKARSNELKFEDEKRKDLNGPFFDVCSDLTAAQRYFVKDSQEKDQIENPVSFVQDLINEYKENKASKNNIETEPTFSNRSGQALIFNKKLPFGFDPLQLWGLNQNITSEGNYLETKHQRSKLENDKPEIVFNGNGFTSQNNIVFPQSSGKTIDTINYLRIRSLTDSTAPEEEQNKGQHILRE